ncbi:LysR family transcriptional regulator [Undibacterium luofuense]|uniref:LysR family transcriptional regulator n=1 Tax=Undibacterium luofuense TaxID=2828733 RepID=UPI0030EBA608
MIEAKDTDLNLLVVFQAVYQERQISLAARRLGLSQPAISNALARLRRTLNDPLFVRTAAGMQPTPRAELFADSVGPALQQITAALNQQGGFDPSGGMRRFTLAMSDVGEVYFMPVLAARLPALAPGVQISTVRANTVDLKTEMESGRIDLALGAFDQLSDAWFQKRIFRQSYVCMMRSEHPLADAELTPAAFRNARHLIVNAREEPYLRINQALEKAGVSIAAQLQVPHYVAVPYIVAQSDLLVTVPQKLAERAAAPFGLCYRKPPVQLPDLSSYLFWHRRYQSDPGNQWLRQLIVETFTEL